MSAKKKDRKRKRIQQQKTHRQELARLSHEEAKELLESLIAQGKSKDSIHTLQQLHLGDLPEFLPIKAKAYACRARQLEEKGLTKESSAVLAILSSVFQHCKICGCEEVAPIIEMAPLSFGMEYYREHEKEHPSCPRIERALANRMVLSNEWTKLDGLPDEHPFKKSASIAAEAVPDMMAARWDEAVSKLEAVSRKSPFAPWKIFAKGMASANRGEEEHLQRALKQLPSDFPLRLTVKTLRDQGFKGLETLGDEVAGPEEEMAEKLVEAIRARDRHLPDLIVEFARRLFPQNVDMAIRSLGEIVTRAFVAQGLHKSEIVKFLPPRFASTIIMRFEMFLTTEFAADFLSFCTARDYLKRMDAEFGNGHREKLEAAVYFLLLSRIVSSRISPYFLLPRDASCLKQWIGNSHLESEDLFIALADKITRLAPDVPAYYHVLKDLDLPMVTSKGKEILEKALMRAQERFPDDPFPYLDLARFYWRRRAYRKSQKILERAWAHLSYDPQVKEQYCLGLLRAAMMSMKRGAAHLAKKDTEAAFDLNVKKLIPLVHAFRATLRLMEENESDAALKSLVALPDPFQRLLAMIYFHHSAWSIGGGDPSFRKAVQEARKRSRRALATDLEKFSDAELKEIVSPFPLEIENLIGPFDVIGFFDTHWPKILAHLRDKQVLGVYAQLLANERYKKQIQWVKKDLRQRLSKQPTNVFFRFYDALADYQASPLLNRNAFGRLLSSLDESAESALREHCRQIAHQFQVPLSNALSHFDFDLLYGSDIGFPRELEESGLWDDWDAIDTEPEELDLLPEDPVAAIVNNLEMAAENRQMLQVMFLLLAEAAEVQGIADESLREMGRELERKGRDVMGALRQIFSGKKLKRLERAGRLILFPDEP